MHQEGEVMQEQQLAERKILTREEVEAHIRDDRNITWVEAKSLLDATAEGCVDGRAEAGVIATPGGNAGEFVLFVQAAEEITGRQLAEDEIREFFRAYVQRYGKFYMHSDMHAMEHIFKAVQANSRFEGLGLQSTAQMEQLIRNCPADVQDDLLAILTDPEMMGCGHLKWMIKTAADYGVRPEIVKTMVATFYRELWNQNPNLEYVVLPGDHQEGAVVIVTVGDGEFDGESLVPTISPMVNGTQLFVDHPQAVKFVRNTVASQIAAEPNLLPGITAENLTAYQEKINMLGDDYLNVTVGKLAVYTKIEDGKEVIYSLPIYKVHYTPQSEFTVEEIQPSKRVA